MTDGGTGQRSSSRALLVAALAVVVALGVIVSWFAWTPSCALREGERVGWWDGAMGRWLRCRGCRSRPCRR